MEARVCDRNEKHVILGDDVEKSGKLSFVFTVPGEDTLVAENWDICPECVPVVAKIIKERIMLAKGSGDVSSAEVDSDDAFPQQADLAREELQEMEGLSLEEALREKASQEKDSKGSKR